MAQSRTPIAGIILVSGVAIAAAVFGFFNWRWLEERNHLERDGIAAVGHIDAVTVSHKACNSSVQVSWSDATAVTHSQHFMTCFANRSPGETLGIRYLTEKPDVAMIATGEGGLPDDQFRRGMMIGAIVAAVLSLVSVHLALIRIRTRA